MYFNPTITSILPLLQSRHYFNPSITSILPLFQSCHYFNPAFTSILPLLQSCHYLNPAITSILQLVQSCHYFNPAITSILPLLQSCHYFKPAISSILPLLQSYHYFNPAIISILQLVQSCHYFNPAITSILPLLQSCHYFLSAEELHIRNGGSIFLRSVVSYVFERTVSRSGRCKLDLQNVFVLYKQKREPSVHPPSFYTLDTKNKTVTCRSSDIRTVQILSSPASVFIRVPQVSYFSLPTYATPNKVVCKSPQIVCFTDLLIFSQTRCLCILCIISVRRFYTGGGSFCAEHQMPRVALPNQRVVYTVT